MITRDAKEYPETIPSEIQGGRPLHFLRLLSWYPLLEYGTIYTKVQIAGPGWRAAAGPALYYRRRARPVTVARAHWQCHGRVRGLRA